MTARPVFPRSDARTLADDGDDAAFCSTCAFSRACLAEGVDKRDLRELHVLVDHVGPIAEGEHVFRKGDRFEAIAAVRAGTVKTYVIDADGGERVLGFHLPGEVIGLDGIDGERYPCSAVALDTVMLCKFSFTRMSALAARLPGLQQQLFRLLARNIGAAIRLGSDGTADQRMAAFLLGLSERLAARGFSARQFRLTMPRTDIGNHLRLAPETVSRVLKRLEDDGLVAIDRREVEILDVEAVRALAAPVTAR